MADKNESVETKTEKTVSAEQSAQVADTAESTETSSVRTAVSSVKNAVSSAASGAIGAVTGLFSKMASAVGIPSKVIALILAVATLASAVVIADTQTYNNISHNDDDQSNPAMIALSDVNPQEDSKLDELYEYKIGRAKKIYRYLRSYDWPEMAIAGVLANANADSNVDASRYEGDDIVNDIVLLRSHHLNWTEYTTALFNIYSGTSSNDVYGGVKTTNAQYSDVSGVYAVEVESRYTGRKIKVSPSGSMYKPAGDVYVKHQNNIKSLYTYYDPDYKKNEYYPGIGLFMWSGERAHNLLDFADCQRFVSDKDNDGHNDVAFEPVFQIAYMLYENKSNIVEKAKSGQYDDSNYVTYDDGERTWKNYKDLANNHVWASLITDTFHTYKAAAKSFAGKETGRPNNNPENWDPKYCYSIEVNLSDTSEGNKYSWVTYEYFGTIVDYTTKINKGTNETCPYDPASLDNIKTHDVVEKNYDIKLIPVYYSIRFNVASLDKSNNRTKLENLIKNTKVEKFKEKFDEFASTFTSDVDYSFEEIKNIPQYVNYRYNTPDETHNTLDQFPSYEYEITGYWDWICEDTTTKTVNSIDTSSVKEKYAEYNSAYGKYLSEKEKYKNAYIEYRQKLDAQKKMNNNQKRTDSLTDCIKEANELKTAMIDFKNDLWNLVWDGYKNYWEQYDTGNSTNYANSRKELRKNIVSHLSTLYDKLIDINKDSEGEIDPNLDTEIKNYLGISSITKTATGTTCLVNMNTTAGRYLNCILNGLGTNDESQSHSYFFNSNATTVYSETNILYNNPATQYLKQVFEITKNMGPEKGHAWHYPSDPDDKFYHMSFITIWSYGKADPNKGNLRDYFVDDSYTKCYFSLDDSTNTYSLDNAWFRITEENSVSYYPEHAHSLQYYNETLTNLKNKTSFSGSWTGSVTVSLTSQGHTNKITISGAGSGSKTFTKLELTNIPKPSITALKTAYNNLRIAANNFSKAKRSYDKNVVNKMLEGSSNDSRRAYFRGDGSYSTNSYSGIKYFDVNGKTDDWTFAGTSAGLGAVKTGRDNIHYNLTNPYDQEYLKPSDQRGFDTYWYLDGYAFGQDTSTIKNVNHEVFDVGDEATTLWTGSEKYVKYHHRYKIAWKNFKGASVLNGTRKNESVDALKSNENGYTKFLDTVAAKMFSIYDEVTKDTAEVFERKSNQGIVGSGNANPEDLHVGIDINSEETDFEFYVKEDGSNNLVESDVSYMAYRLQEDLAYQFAVWFYQSWKDRDFVKMNESDFVNHTESARYWYQLMIVNNWHEEFEHHKDSTIRLDRTQLGTAASVVDQWYVDDKLYTSVVDSMIPEKDEEPYNVSTGTILDMYSSKLRKIGSFDNSTIADTAMSLSYPLGSYNYGISDMTSGREYSDDYSIYAARTTELYAAVANTAYAILARGTNISVGGTGQLTFGGIAAPQDTVGQEYYTKTADGSWQSASPRYSSDDYARMSYNNPWQALWTVIFVSGRDEKFPIYISTHNNEAVDWWSHSNDRYKMALGYLGYEKPCLDASHSEDCMQATDAALSWSYVGMIVPDNTYSATSSDNTYCIPVSQVPVKLKPGDICVNHRNAFIYLGDAVKNNTKFSYYYKYDNTDYAIAMAMESDDMTGHGLAVAVNPPDDKRDNTSNAPVLYPGSSKKSTAKHNPIKTLMDNYCDEDGGYYAVFRSINDDYELTDGYQLFRTLDFSLYPDGSRRSELKYGSGSYQAISNIASDVLYYNAEIAREALPEKWVSDLNDIHNDQERYIQTMRAMFFNRVAVRKKSQNSPS